MGELRHLMVDIETMGTNPGCALLSIGAVEFDIETGATGREFYAPISLQSNSIIGLEYDADTILWWMNQSDDARKLIFSIDDKITVNEALINFRFFLNTIEYSLWGNSVRFDLGILAEAYNRAHIKIPWNTKKEMDVRTLVAFNPELKQNQKFEGILHNPIDDCKHQIKYCTEIWKSLTHKN